MFLILSFYSYTGLLLCVCYWQLYTVARRRRLYVGIHKHIVGIGEHGWMHENALTVWDTSLRLAFVYKTHLILYSEGIQYSFQTKNRYTHNIIINKRNIVIFFVFMVIYIHGVSSDSFY